MEEMIVSVCFVLTFKLEAPVKERQNIIYYLNLVINDFHACFYVDIYISIPHSDIYLFPRRFRISNKICFCIVLSSIERTASSCFVAVNVNRA